MLNILFIVAREIFEASLIISIIYTFLKKENMADKGRHFLGYGVIGGILLSLGLAYALYNLTEWLEGAGLLYFETALFLVSAILMTHMVFWMRRMGRHLKGEIEGNLQQSLQKTGLIGVSFIAALGIGREGAEAATYIYSMSLSGQTSHTDLLIGSCGGIIVALALAQAISRGIGRLNLKTFFSVTSFFLFLTSGALILEATSRMVELGLLPNLIPVVWNTSHVIPANSWLGGFLGTLIGYKPQPSLMMVLVYATYWSFVLIAFYGKSLMRLLKSLSPKSHSVPGTIACLMVGLVSLINSQPAKAIDYHELEVYPWHTEPTGITEIENYFLWSNGAQESFGSSILRNTLEINHGITDNIEMAIYGDFEKLSPDEKWKYHAVRLRGHMSFFEKGELPVDLGAYVEAAFPKTGPIKNELELKGIIEKDLGRFTLILNPTLEFEKEEESKVNASGAIEKETENETEFVYSAAVFWRASSTLVPKLSVFDNLKAGAKHQFLIFPSVDYRFSPGWETALGVGLGQTDATEKRLVSLKVEFEF